ncbi:hypothetical protein HK102_005106 [Quaeritorhiza haematococci]|nr:hypothetical protein HK102_005106 [Quaeritorhiza haematococci]
MIRRTSLSLYFSSASTALNESSSTIGVFVFGGSSPSTTTTPLDRIAGVKGTAPKEAPATSLILPVTKPAALQPSGSLPFRTTITPTGCAFSFESLAPSSSPTTTTGRTTGTATTSGVSEATSFLADSIKVDFSGKWRSRATFLQYTNITAMQPDLKQNVTSRPAFPARPTNPAQRADSKSSFITNQSAPSGDIKARSGMMGAGGPASVNGVGFHDVSSSIVVNSYHDATGTLDSNVNVRKEKDHTAIKYFLEIVSGSVEAAYWNAPRRKAARLLDYASQSVGSSPIPSFDVIFTILREAVSMHFNEVIYIANPYPSFGKFLKEYFSTAPYKTTPRKRLCLPAKSVRAENEERRCPGHHCVHFAAINLSTSCVRALLGNEAGSIKFADSSSTVADTTPPVASSMNTSAAHIVVDFSGGWRPQVPSFLQRSDFSLTSLDLPATESPASSGEGKSSTPTPNFIFGSLSTTTSATDGSVSSTFEFHIPGKRTPPANTNVGNSKIFGSPATTASTPNVSSAFDFDFRKRTAPSTPGDTKNTTKDNNLDCKTVPRFEFTAGSSWLPTKDSGGPMGGTFIFGLSDGPLTGWGPLSSRVSSDYLPEE